jgi:hypothetical protein
VEALLTQCLVRRHSARQLLAFDYQQTQMTAQPPPIKHRPLAANCQPPTAGRSIYSSNSRLQPTLQMGHSNKKVNQGICGCCCCCCCSYVQSTVHRGVPCL